MEVVSRSHRHWHDWHARAFYSVQEAPAEDEAVNVNDISKAFKDSQIYHGGFYAPNKMTEQVSASCSLDMPQ